MKKEEFVKLCVKNNITFYPVDFMNHCLNCKNFENELKQRIKASKAKK